MVVVRAYRRMNLSMEKADLREFARRTGKQSRQVFVLLIRDMSNGRHVSDGISRSIVNEESSWRGVGSHPYTRRPTQSSRTLFLRPWIVVSGCVHDRDTVIVEARGLREKKSFRLEGKPLSVEQVPRDQERVGVLSNREVDGVVKGLTGRLTKPFPDFFGTAGERRI